ncbi:MAG TPA: IclR family transcriptional regulator [Dermatophilaceae bacterium]|nr:IclR family transcriptional regulator [Dermatophilaceae bacterium]
MRLLRFLAAQAAPMPAARIAASLGLPRSSVYHLLAVLRREGFVTHFREERRYGLGLASFELGSAYSRQAPLQRLARPVVARLVDTVGHNGHLGVLHGNEVLYLIEERAAGRPALVTEVGVRLPASLTASGLAMLSALPAAQVRALYPARAAFVRRHGAGPTSLAELRRLLVDVRRDGFAREDGQVTVGFASVAAPVRDHWGHPLAAVALTYASADVPPAERDRLAAAVLRSADDLSRRVLGG